MLRGSGLLPRAADRGQEGGGHADRQGEGDDPGGPRQEREAAEGTVPKDIVSSVGLKVPQKPCKSGLQFCQRLL